MITISLCMIVKNEELVISRCLDSISDIVDEIIIIDTGSTDNTRCIARQYTNYIFDFQWIDNFSAARNASFSKASMDYIFWLDADDVLKAEDQKKFIKLKGSLDASVDSVTMDYHLAFDEYGNISFSTWRNRLVKRTNSFLWIGAVHEYLEVSGKVIHSDIAITHKSLFHDSDRNLKIYEKCLKQGDKFSPRDLYYFANELIDHQMYKRAIDFYEQFLSSGEGWVEDNISSCGKLADCYHHLGVKELELEAILHSFHYGTPRAEFCCRLGYHFLQQNDISAAIVWYKLAIQLEPPKVPQGFFNPSFSTWLPHLQLCVCYDRIGNHKLAYLHNEAAREYRPNDCNILKNREYLESILNQAN
jgi:glycosyltransferase involved in cell wall biosynthesis